MNKNQSKVTCSFRIAPDNKLAISSIARSMDMSPAQYLEAIVLDKSNQIVVALNEQKKPPEIREVEKVVIEKVPVEVEKYYFEKKDLQRILNYLEPLKERYPNRSEVELILVALHAAEVNQNALLIKPIHKLFNQID